MSSALQADEVDEASDWSAASREASEEPASDEVPVLAVAGECVEAGGT